MENTQLKYKAFHKTDKDFFYRLTLQDLTFVLTLPIEKKDDYQLNIDFKCKWNDSNYSQFEKRLNEINKKYPSPSNIMISLIGFDGLDHVDIEQYKKLENQISDIIAIASYFINQKTEKTNYFNNNTRLLNSPEIDEAFLDRLEKYYTTKKKKAGNNETQYIEFIKGEKSNIELTDEFKDLIKNKMPDDIELDKFIEWLNKSMPIKSINSLDDLFKLYKEKLEKKLEENNETIDNVIKTKGLNKTTGELGMEYITKKNEHGTSLLINRDNKTLQEQVQTVQNEVGLNNNDPWTTLLNTDLIVDKFKETKEEIPLDPINRMESVSNESLETQANNIVANNYENKTKKELIGSNSNGIYVQDDGTVVEHRTSNNNGIINVNVNTLTSNIKQDEETLITNEESQIINSNENKLIEKERLEEIRKSLLERQEEDYRKEKEQENKDLENSKKMKKLTPSPQTKTGYINYYFLITVTIICILILLLIR